MGSPSGGSSGSNGPGGSDNGGGQREAEEARERQAASFEHTMDNSNRPDRAPAGPPEAGASPSTPPAADIGETDTTDDDHDDKPDDRSFLDRVGDALTAPPTDSEGNPRSTSPVADRLRNHTVNYSLDDIKDIFTGDPDVTPEQSQALADGAAVIDGFSIIPAMSPKPEVLSPLQASAAIADAELQVSVEVYNREASARITEIDERVETINARLSSNAPTRNIFEDLRLAEERETLSTERQELEQSLSSPEATLSALRGGDEEIGLDAETLELVVTHRDELAEQIKQKEAELEAASLSEIVFINEDIEALKQADERALDLGLAFQNLVDQEQKLEAGETVYISRTRPQSWGEFVATEAIATMVGFGLGNAVRVPKYVDNLIDGISGTTVGQGLHHQQQGTVEGVVTIQRRDDGGYDIMVSEPYDPNATYASVISFYELTKEGETWSTGTRLDGGNLQGEPVNNRERRRIDDFDLGALTNGNAQIIDGSIRIAPDMREEVERLMLGNH